MNTVTSQQTQQAALLPPEMQQQQYQQPSTPTPAAHSQQMSFNSTFPNNLPVSSQSQQSQLQSPLTNTQNVFVMDWEEMKRQSLLLIPNNTLVVCIFFWFPLCVSSFTLTQKNIRF